MDVLLYFIKEVYKNYSSKNKNILEHLGMGFAFVFVSVVPEAVVSEVRDVADVALGGDGIFQVVLVLGTFGRILLVNARNNLMGKITVLRSGCFESFFLYFIHSISKQYQAEILSTINHLNFFAGQFFLNQRNGLGFEASKDLPNSIQNSALRS